MYIAHIRESDGVIQSVEDHLLEVKVLAEGYGEKLGIKHVAGLAGLLHDMGKFTEAFKTYIWTAVHDPEHAQRRGSVDHSTAGGKLLFEYFHQNEKNVLLKVLAEVVGNAIISHHSYLHDFISPDLELPYFERVAKKELPEWSETKARFFQYTMDEESFRRYVMTAAEELRQFMVKSKGKNTESLMFLTKYIFSMLIDADRTNTRMFEERAEVETTLHHETLFSEYYEKLMNKIRSFKRTGHVSVINQLRAAMSQQCDQFAERPSGIYTLSIPTGGGKTLASLRYALKHALRHGKKRIIYIVPYTTIIEQNAEEVRKIIQDDEHLLEHHSNVVEDVYESDEAEVGLLTTSQKLKLAKDNWDVPIIFTTMVQFLHVFYAKGSQNARRLHNISEAVLVFDEVQKVPVHCISLFNQALNFIKSHAECSVILCTATQPALTFVEHKLDVGTDAEIVSNLDEVTEAFKRVTIIDRATEESFNNDKVVAFVQEQMEQVRSTLIILNTKSVVKDLYIRLKKQFEDVPIYHLSTSMCAAHRQEILRKVREHLQLHEKVICVSTQLIEAGVDVSFSCVIRSLAGLDSIAQAAGRCNRHGEQPMQKVYVIHHEEENVKKLLEIAKGKQEANKIFIDLKRDGSSHGGSVLSQYAMAKYFREFYGAFTSEINYFIPKLRKNMTELLTVSPAHNSYVKSYKSQYSVFPLCNTNSYRTAAEHFHVIDNHTRTVLVPYEGGTEIIAELNGSASISGLGKLLKKAQKYTISIYDQEFRQLLSTDGIVSYADGHILALKEGMYDQEFGLNVVGNSYMDAIMY
jgi:CRISPR-associated endonuclease/helicase Cas3